MTVAETHSSEEMKYFRVKTPSLGNKINLQLSLCTLLIDAKLSFTSSDTELDTRCHRFNVRSVDCAATKITQAPNEILKNLCAKNYLKTPVFQNQFVSVSYVNCPFRSRYENPWSGICLCLCTRVEMHIALSWMLQVHHLVD